MSPLEKKKALQDTASWCLERCIKLGHCEVFEDLNKMSTAQVQDFCKACVLTGEATQDECDVSMMFIEDGPWASIDRAAVGVKRTRIAVVAAGEIVTVLELVGGALRTS